MPTDEQMEAVKKAIHDGLGGNGWAYSNYGHDELNNCSDMLEGAALAALAAMNQWQPIETAPKDGTWCLFFQPENKKAMMPKAKRQRCSVDAFDKEWPKARYQMPETPYTHWMPLPEPPVTP